MLNRCCDFQFLLHFLKFAVKYSSSLERITTAVMTASNLKHLFDRHRSPISEPETSPPVRQSSLEVAGNAVPETFACETRLGITAQWSVTPHESIPREEMLTAEY